MTDSETRAVLKTAFLVLKTQSVAISALRADVGALRHALVEVAPDYRSAVERHHQKHIDELRRHLHDELSRLQEVLDHLEQ